MTCLYVDIGNSDMKWRCGLSGRARRVPRKDFMVMLDEAVLREGRVAVSRILVSSVANDDLNQRLSKICHARLGIEPEFAAVSDRVAGLRLAYQKMSNLGVDRWLAMLAAREAFPSKRLLVLDVGSAVTADVLSAEGEHVGGYISPGLPLMEKLFIAHGDRIQIQGLALSSSLRAGRSTLDCVQNGVTAMLVGFVQEVLCVEAVDVLIWTGGGAEALRALCRITHEDHLRPEAVLEGLHVMDSYVL